MFYHGKNVLVAGGAGLIGQTLIRHLLREGAHVRATQYKSRTITLEDKNLQVVPCDLTRDEEARSVFKNMDIVFLAAARVRGAKQIKEDPSGLILYNLNLHAKLFHLAAETGIERCIHISSSYVYPDTGKPNVESEGFQADPCQAIYGLGWFHRYLETLCKHFHHHSKTKFAVIRPTAYYGPYDQFNPAEAHVIPALIARAVSRANPFEVWGNGEDERCFTYVDDVVSGLLLAAEKYAVAEPLNICAQTSHKVKDVLHLIFKLLDFHPQVAFNTSMPSTIPYKVSSPKKAMEILGWEAKVSLEEGLKRTIDWYVAQISPRLYV